MSKTIPRLHVITDETIQARHSHAELARFAAEGGADCVQYREKRPLTTRELVEVAGKVLDSCRRGQLLLVVDDRADVALEVGAPALHLGRNDLDPIVARRILGSSAIIGGTANSLEEAQRVWTTGVDYLGVGPIFGTRSKRNPAPTMGLDTLARIAAACPLPVIAIGTITAPRIPEVIEAGAHGCAVLSYVVKAQDPVVATSDCAEALAAATANG